jgi:Pyridoxamine 5'-phosphate oxidase
VISDEVLAFLSGGKSLVIATRDPTLLAECARGVGLRAGTDREHVSVFLPGPSSARTLANLRDNGRIAIGLSHPPDHRSLQLKGRVSALEPATDEELAFVRGYIAELSAVLDVIGLPARVVSRLNYLPCFRADVRVEEIYLQTPGPDAGSLLGGRAP